MLQKEAGSRFFFVLTLSKEPTWTAKDHKKYRQIYFDLSLKGAAVESRGETNFVIRTKELEEEVITGSPNEQQEWTAAIQKALEQVSEPS